MLRFAKSFLGVLALLLSTTALAQTTSRGPVARPMVIGGSKSPNGAYPWMVALLAKYDGHATKEHFCGGTLIAPQWVMTAAHCVADFQSPSDELEVLIGQNTLSSGTGVRVPARGVVVHPGFDPFYISNDFALIKLEFPVSYAPIGLARTSDQDELYRAGNQAKVLGWGVTDPRLPILPDDLREAILPLVNDDTCLEANGRFFESGSMVCAGEFSPTGSTARSSSACFGDSGGPLVVSKNGQPLQIGIVSWGYECASPTTFNVFAKTVSALDFLDSRPQIAPYLSIQSAALQLSGDFRVGGTVTASPLQWKGDVATSMRYEWYLRSSPSNRLVVTTDAASLKLPADFADGYLLVRAIASNEGGEGFAESEASFVEANHGGNQDPGLQDTTKPTISRAGNQYPRGAFTVLVLAEDAAPSAGISSVVADVTAVIPAKKRAGRQVSPRQVIHDRIAATPVGGGLYKFTIQASKGIRYSLSVRATDAAGLESEALSFRLRKP